MIRIQYHPQLIEGSVSIAVRHDDNLQNALHQVIDPIYELQDTAERERQFRKAYVDWFMRLKLDRFIDETLSNFPNVVECVDEGFVRSASRSKSQRADLFVKGEADQPRRSLVIQLCPESLIDPSTIRDMLLRELQHVEDMLDASFAYQPDPMDGLPSQQQVARDRYCVLWDIRIESILVRKGLIERCAKEQLIPKFLKAFTAGGISPAPDCFDRLWRADLATHAEILHRATRRLDGPCESESDDAVRQTVAPGSSCPMCGFPTFDWFEINDARVQQLGKRIRESIVAWTPDDGVCRQCAETLLSGTADSRMACDPKIIA